MAPQYLQGSITPLPECKNLHKTLSHLSSIISTKIPHIPHLPCPGATNPFTLPCFSKSSLTLEWPFSISNHFWWSSNHSSCSSPNATALWIFSHLFQTHLFQALYTHNASTHLYYSLFLNCIIITVCWPICFWLDYELPESKDHLILLCICFHPALSIMPGT